MLLSLLASASVFVPLRPVRAAAMTSLHAQETSASTSNGESSETGGWKDTIFKWINFAILFGGLAYVLRKPMVEFFASRKELIRKSIEEAKAAKARAEEELAQVLSKLEQVQQEIGSLKSAAEAQAKVDGEKILDAAKEEAKRIVSSAQEEVALMVKHAQKELREESAALVVKMAEGKLKDEIRPEHQGPLFEKFVASINTGDRPKQNS